ncbi:hypothetical protein U5922_014480 [Aquicoccus sp. G2-2]|uniref:hypothetical protein n=1 Tax=Aquicoccus sp. G2-2 TaxID=3092120 RepID=UPI002ADF305F|nr:hypothetical protein [Aquicoccus sp. G2-2]MEA1114603.1 hypothetical protein [Aquicoccus sp. G2-2]
MDFNELIVRFTEAISRRRRLFVLAFLIVFMGTVVGAYLKPQKFESNAKLLITLQLPRVNSTLTEQRQIIANLAPEEVMASNVEVMQTREMLEELVDSLPEWVFVPEPSTKWYIVYIAKPLANTLEYVKDGLRKARLIEPENERLNRISMLKDNLSIFPVRKAHVIEIGFQSKNPAIPPVVIDQLLKLYHARVEAMRARSEGVALYADRANELSQELEAAENELASFMLANQISDYEIERNALAKRVSEQGLRADRDRLTELTELAPQYHALSRRVSILSESFSIYRRVAADRQTFFGRDMNIITQIIDPPSTIYHPEKPSRLTLVLIGLVFALFLATILVLLTEWIARVRNLYREEAPHVEFSRDRLKVAE